MVVAAGVDVARLELPEHARVPVRPVKGQVLRLRDPAAPASWSARSAASRRTSSRAATAATCWARRWRSAAGTRRPTAGGVYELLRDLSELVPGIFELEIEELIAGLRPATPDNLPAIGRGALDGLIWATGHFRNGILLTPVTAELVAAALAGEPLPDFAAAADPLRFAEVPA